MPIDRIAVGALLGSGLRLFMDNQLMAVEVEVDPVRAGATLLQPKHFAIKGSSAWKVINRDCEVEGRKAHHGSCCFL